MAREKLGFVGLGRMGANMARRAKDLGYPVVALYDIRPDAAKELAAEVGGEACASLARVAELADTIVTVVTDDRAMEAIYAASGDSLLAAAKGKLFINCATITPQVHVDVEELVDRAGGLSLEACMASSIPQAREGTLYLMVAGRKAAFERAEPLLRDLSRSLRYVGAAGEAAKVKTLVNMVMNINTAGLAEGLGLGAALGLDLDMLRAVFAETGANSRVLETDGGDMQGREHDVYFSASHAAKDSGIAVALAHAENLELPLAEATLGQYQEMVAKGLGELDKSGIAELTFKGRNARTRA